MAKKIKKNCNQRIKNKKNKTTHQKYSLTANLIRIGSNIPIYNADGIASDSTADCLR